LKKKSEKPEIPPQEHPESAPLDEASSVNPPERDKPTAKEYFTKLLPLLKSFVLWFILVGIAHLPFIKDGFRNLVVGFTTSTTYGLGKALFIPIVRSAFDTLQINGFPMQIIVECTAYNFFLFAIALIIFAPWSWKNKLINLGIFFVAIFLVNNLRFFAMGYIGRYYPDFFDTTHDYVWNILFGFMVFGIWAWRDRKSNLDYITTEHHEV
jgi:exosortase/archaeosortase family protein